MADVKAGVEYKINVNNFLFYFHSTFACLRACAIASMRVQTIK